jgi:hypothetical protein
LRLCSNADAVQLAYELLLCSNADAVQLAYELRLRSNADAVQLASELRLCVALHCMHRVEDTALVQAPKVWHLNLLQFNQPTGREKYLSNYARSVPDYFARQQPGLLGM